MAKLPQERKSESAGGVLAPTGAGAVPGAVPGAGGVAAAGCDGGGTAAPAAAPTATELANNRKGGRGRR